MKVAAQRPPRHTELLPGLLCFAAAILSAATLSARETDSAKIEFFEKKIRPALVEHCYECHDSTTTKMKGGLALNSPAGTRNGGDSGPVIATGNPETSLLIQSIRRIDRDLEMPPKSPLPASVVKDFEQWIAMGAPDPRPEVEEASPAATGMSPEEGREFWSFRPRRSIEIPGNASGRNPIDAFLTESRFSKGLIEAEPTDKATWLRRVTFDLTGLPPAPNRVRSFLADDSPTAKEGIVSELLNSPEYGVRWGRHWLDVARYADSNGLDENLTFGNAWRYRDYVFESFQNDLPFDQFLIEQIAGDLLPDADERTKVATGFLALGARVLAEPDREKLEMDVIDEQLDTMGKAFLGLTIGCARCHDHKFDPILQSDYYSLAAIFRNSTNFGETKTGVIKHWYEHDFATEEEKESLKGIDEKIAKAKAAARSFKTKTATSLRGIARSKAVQYLLAATEFQTGTSLDVVADIGRDESLHPRVLVNTRRHLEMNRENPVFSPWWDFAEREDREGLRAFYEEKFGRAVLEFTALQKVDPKAKELPDEELERFRAALFDKSGFLTIPAKPEHAFDEAQLAEYYKLEEEARILESNAPDHPAAMGIADEGEIKNTLPIHIRGSHNNLGVEVPRAVPAVFSKPDLKFPETKSGRLELAQWMASPENPLTVRVIVNRVWRWHFGSGLVTSTENFGVIGDTPVHPELLDWLANWFVENGWSIKKLNRLIVLSEAYGRSSTPPNPDWKEVDPDNRYLTFFPVKRLEAEAIRDSILAVSGRIDLEKGGKTVPLRNRQMVFNHTSKDHTTYDSLRRTSFLPIVRNNVFNLLPLFDFPDPTMPTGNRQSTVIAPQALLMMNAPLLRESASAFAHRVLGTESEPKARVELAWQLAYARSPDSTELGAALAFLDRADHSTDQWTLLCHSLFASNDFIYLN